MFFRFQLDSPNLSESSGNKLTSLLGSFFVSVAICSAASTAIAAGEGEDILPQEQFQAFSDDSAPIVDESDNGKGKSHSSNGQNGDGASTTSLLGVGASEMMPTEFYIESDQYGTGQYRRYIGYTESDDGTKKKSGKLIQEILVTRDDADALEKLPHLNVGRVPEGLQVTGFVAVKMWLSVVLTKYDACLKKPKMTNSTWEWASVDYEHESSRNDCALSFRLTANTSAPGQMLAHKSKVFLTGELCRYPEGNTQFSSKKDDAECITMPTVTVSKKERLFLSETDEKLRAVRSVLIAQIVKNKGLASYLYSLNPFSAEDKTPELGDSIDMFSKFVSQLSSMSDTAYNWQMDPEYLGELEGAMFNEVITGVHPNPTKLANFLKSYGDAGFKADSRGNLQSAGIESSVSEMHVMDDETEAEKVAFTFKLESKKGMSFSHENGELIQLLDNSELSPMGKKNIQLREVQSKLNRCQVQRIDAEARCKKLTDEKDLLVTELENERQHFAESKKLLNEKIEGLTNTLNLLEGQRDLARSTEEMDAVQEERDKHRTAMDDLKAEHGIAIKKLEQNRDLTISDAEADHKVKTNKINVDLTNAKKDVQIAEAKADRLEKSETKLQKKVTKLEKDLKDAEDELNDRVNGANKAYRDQIQELKKENARLEKESDRKGTLLRDAENDKQQALREERLKYARGLESLRATVASDMATVKILLKTLYDARGYGSDVEDPSNHVLPSFDVLDDANGIPKAVPIRFSKRS